MKIEPKIKIILIVLLLLCLLHMPYGYYKFLRIACTVGFTALALLSLKGKKDDFTIIYCGLIILFQPFYKIYLGREIWQIVDIVTASILALSLITRNKLNIFR